MKNKETNTFFVWHGRMETYKKLYFYTVSSAYHGEWKHQFYGRTSNMNAPGGSAVNKVWDELWGSSVSANVKIFGWKTLHGVLLSYKVLANRRMAVSSQCPRCAIQSEDIKHVLFTCDHVKEDWRKLGLEARIEEALIVDRAGSAVLEDSIMNQSIGDKMESILTAAWYIWWMRRQLVHAEKVPTNTITAMYIQVITKNNIRSLRKNPITRRSKWVKPREGFVMINIDASFNLDNY